MIACEEVLAHTAIDTGCWVAWFILTSLTAAVGRAAADGSTTRAITKIVRRVHTREKPM